MQEKYFFIKMVAVSKFKVQITFLYRNMCVNRKTNIKQLIQRNIKFPLLSNLILYEE